MSSDVIAFGAASSLEEEGGNFTTRPFLDICDRIYVMATACKNEKLAEKVTHAKFDDYLDLSESDDDELALIEEVVREVLSDPSFFAWQIAWQQDPIFIEQCLGRRTTPLAESMLVRKAAESQLIRLLELLHMRMSGGNKDYGTLHCAE